MARSKRNSRRARPTRPSSAGSATGSRVSTRPGKQSSVPVPPAVPRPLPRGREGGDALVEHPVVTTNMGWRIMAVVVLFFLGLTATFFLDGHPVYGALWAVVTVGWAFFTVKLYRRHNAYVQSL